MKDSIIVLFEHDSKTKFLWYPLIVDVNSVCKTRCLDSLKLLHLTIFRQDTSRFWRYNRMCHQVRFELVSKNVYMEQTFSYLWLNLCNLLEFTFFYRQEFHFFAFTHRKLIRFRSCCFRFYADKESFVLQNTFPRRHKTFFSCHKCFIELQIRRVSKQKGKMSF